MIVWIGWRGDWDKEEIRITLRWKSSVYLIPLTTRISMLFL